MNISSLYPLSVTRINHLGEMNSCGVLFKKNLYRCSHVMILNDRFCQWQITELKKTSPTVFICYQLLWVQGSSFFTFYFCNLFQHHGFVNCFQVKLYVYQMCWTILEVMQIPGCILCIFVVSIYVIQLRKYTMLKNFHHWEYRKAFQMLHVSFLWLTQKVMGRHSSH